MRAAVRRAYLVRRRNSNMRMFTKLIATAAVAVTGVALAVAPALADPPGPLGGNRPAPDNSIVGVGSNTIQNLMNQLSIDYNSSKPTPPAPMYSWDSLNPKTGADDLAIATKKGCSSIERPNGSGAGLAALILNAKVTYTVTVKHKKHKITAYCIDFSRSSSPRGSTAPPKGPGGVVYVALAKDAVTWASNAGSNAPSNLTTADLANIYNCVDTNWSDFGGKNATIDAQLPQTSSGTRKFFLAQIGVTAPGSCVNSAPGESATTPAPNGNYPEENEGVNPFLQGPNVIYPYSVGAYLAETQHSASCTNKSCTNCKPKKG